MQREPFRAGDLRKTRVLVIGFNPRLHESDTQSGYSIEHPVRREAIREPASIEYFEDIELHQTYRSREYRLSGQEIIRFAGEWDPRPFHLDPEFARRTKIGGLFASSAHLYAITMKLVCERKPEFASVAALGVDRVRFANPARPDDVLVMEGEITNKRDSRSNPAVGIVHMDVKLFNQRKEVVISYRVSALVEKRPKLMVVRDCHQEHTRDTAGSA